MATTLNLRTVIELASFQRAAATLTVDERIAIATMVAERPEAGDVIPGAGGARKIRFAIGGQGKSGGARVIYYAGSVVIYLLTIYVKGAKANLSQREIKTLHTICKELE